MENDVENVPLIYNFTIQNVSEDNINKVKIEINSDVPLEIYSSSRTSAGFSFRVKCGQKEEDIFPESQLQPPKPKVIAPETVLPFTSDIRTTVEFREAELQDIFRMFMAALDRNIVLDASFPRDLLVTMTLVDVRIDEIMNYLLRTYDIACYAYGPNITAFGTREGLYKLSGARNIKTFRIAYAEPATVSTMLQSLTGISGSELVIDERMRTLYVNTNPAKMEEVEDLISRIDVPSRQVMIRASIFEFNDSATLDVQNSLNMVYDRWTLNYEPGDNKGVLKYVDRTYSQGRSAFDRYITNTLSALESRNKGKTIANPSVIAIDGQSATISLKQDIMYSSGLDENRNTTWSTTNVGPEMTFTPIIEDNGYINLQITINTGDYLGKDADGNIITTDRNVTTKIRVKDGMPFVVGGLFEDSKINVRTKIPILGDLPLLGKLFTSYSTDNAKNQAVMIVTPYIIESN